MRFLVWVEDNLPHWTIFWQTHHWYILAEKVVAEGEGDGDDTG